jgi:uncharacterized membrane protein YhhN
LVLIVGLTADFGLIPLSFDAYIHVGFPIILALLLVLYSKLRGRFHRRILIGFLALSLGAFLFMRQGSPTISFIAFALLPLSFTRAFYLDFSSTPELDKKGARVAIVFGLVFSFSVYLWLRPYLGAYHIPALIFTFLLALMMMMAAFRRFRVNAFSFSVILSGCMLFAAAAIACTYVAFVRPLSIINAAGDFLYICSLYMILLGSIERKLVIQP